MFESTTMDRDPKSGHDRLEALNALARALTAATSADLVGALAVRAAHVLAGATHAWLWLRDGRDAAGPAADAPAAGVAGVPLEGADGRLGVLWAVGADRAVLEAIAFHAAHALEARRLREALAEARREAHTDALTGLWNRRHACAAIEREAAVARRLGRPFAALVLDVDRFKALNDALGHEAGDQALAHVAGKLAATARDSDLVARWGGEEFLVLCPATGPDQAVALAERLRRAVAEQPVAIGPAAAWPVTISVGVAGWRPDDERPDAAIARADRALYAAKGGGRDRVVADTQAA